MSRGRRSRDRGYISGNRTIAAPTYDEVLVDYLVVAGGGAGTGRGNRGGGGGGAGGLRSTVTATGGGGTLETALTLLTGTGFTVTVGAGGTGSPTVLTGGSDSIFSTITSKGGGRGGYSNDAPSGGSGGGGDGSGTNLSGGAGTANQGFAGGTGGVSGSFAGGGGGGAGAVGANNSGTTGGSGGAGVATSITGSSVTYAGGGGGGATGVAGTGGSGGGGNGSTTTNGTAGTANTGGGGGGSGASTDFLNSNGGSGVVILRYSNLFALNVGAGLAYSTQAVSDDKVTTFTGGSGSVSFSLVPVTTGDYESIATVLVGSAGASSVTFSNIPQTYKHLQLRIIARTTFNNNDDYLSMRFNGDSGANYTYHGLYALNTTPGAYGSGNQTILSLQRVAGASAANTFGIVVADILDYTSVNKFKTFRNLGGCEDNTQGSVYLHSGVWQNTAAITSVQIFGGNASSTLVQHSHLALYGIRG